MTTPALPSNGDTGWGTTLNAYITDVVKAEADQTETSFSAHAANSPADPHGDRAYALQIMAPILANVNAATGFVQLDANGRLPSNDPWHDFRPVSGNFGIGSGYPPQYRIDLDGRVWLAGYVLTTSLAYNGVGVFTTLLASPYKPSKPVQIRVTASAAGTGSSYQPAMLTVGTDGSVTFEGLPTGLAAGTAIGIYGSYPSDAANSLIQS